MKYPEQLSVRVPEGTKARLRAVAAPRETLVSVLLRAIEALEAPAKPEPDPVLIERIEALEQRISELERAPRPLFSLWPRKGRNPS